MFYYTMPYYIRPETPPRAPGATVRRPVGFPGLRLDKLVFEQSRSPKGFEKIEMCPPVAEEVAVHGFDHNLASLMDHTRSP